MKKLLFVLLAAFAAHAGQYYDTIISQNTNLLSYHTSDTTAAGLLIDTIGTFDGTITNATVLTKSHMLHNYVQYRRADTSYVNYGQQPALETLGNLSISFVFRIESGALSNNMALFDKYSIGVVTNAGKLKCGVNYWPQHNNNIPLSGNVVENTWYHFAMTFDGSQATAADRIKIYINGAEVASAMEGTVGVTTTSHQNFTYTGQASWINGWGFDGDLDELSIWTRTLSGTEVAGQYNAFLADTATDYVAPTEPAIVLTSNFASRTIFQRDYPDTTKTINITGTYTDTAIAIEAAVFDSSTGEVIVDWVAIDSAPSGGTFAGTITVPWGYWYSLKVRVIDTNITPVDTAIMPNKWGVGIRYALFGQSNVGYETGVIYSAANDGASMWHYANGYQLLEDPIGTAGGGTGTWGASMAPALANSIIDTLGIPVCIVPYALPSTGLVGGPWARDASAFDTSQARIDSVGGVEGEVFVQGENDQYYNQSYNNYYTAQTEYVNGRVAANGPNYKIILVIVGRRTESIATGTDERYSAIRAAKLQVASENANVYVGPNGIAARDKGDGIHWDKSSQDTIGIQVAAIVRYILGDLPYYRGPRITGANYGSDSTNVNLFVNHNGTGITIVDSVRGYFGRQVSDGIWVEATTQTLTSNTLSLVFSNAVDSVYGLYGLNPTATATGNSVTTIIKDNTPYRFAMEPTNGALHINSLINTHPSNQTVASGSTATFTVSASSDSAITYQWQRYTDSWANVSGATDSTYATDTLTTLDDGDSVRVIITYGDNVDTSNIAIITVNFKHNFILQETKRGCIIVNKYRGNDSIWVFDSVGGVLIYSDSASKDTFVIDESCYSIENSIKLSNNNGVDSLVSYTTLDKNFSTFTYSRTKGKSTYFSVMLLSNPLDSCFKKYKGELTDTDVMVDAYTISSNDDTTSHSIAKSLSQLGTTGIWFKPFSETEMNPNEDRIIWRIIPGASNVIDTTRWYLINLE